MKFILSVALMLFSLQSVFGQEKSQLTFEKGRISENGQTILAKDAVELMANYPEALSFMKKAKTNTSFAQIFGGIGGALIGFPLGTSIGGGDPNWALAGIGGVVILAALPFNSAFKKNTKAAIKLYNEANPKASYQRPSIQLGLLETGFGLRFSF